MKKLLKNLGSVTMAFVMVLMVTLPANAATSREVHDSKLYKDGLFNANEPSQNLSMGDGAIGKTTVISNGLGYTITIDINEDFTAHGFKGKITRFTCSDPNVTTVLKDLNQNGINDTVVMTTNSLTYPQLFNVNVTIDVWIMPINAAADLVIF